MSSKRVHQECFVSGLVSLFILLSTINYHDCRSLYVSNSGTDINVCGDLSQPCKTINYTYREKVGFNDTVVLMNRNCDEYVVNETIVLSHSSVDIRGTIHNGCRPAIKGKSSKVLFHVETNVTYLHLSIDSLTFQDIGFLSLSSDDNEYVSVRITNCLLEFTRGYPNYGIYVETPKQNSRFDIYIYNCSFISCGLQIAGNINQNGNVTITHSLFSSNAFIKISSANSLTTRKTIFRDIMSPRQCLISTYRVQQVIIIDVMLEDFIFADQILTSSFAKTVTIARVEIENISSSNQVFNIEFVDAFKATDITMEKGSSFLSITQASYGYNGNVSLTNISITNTQMKHFAFLKFCPNITLAVIKFENVSTQDDFLHVYYVSFFHATYVTVSNIHIKNGKFWEMICPTSSNVYISDISVKNVSSYDTTFKIYSPHTVLLSNVYISKVKTSRNVVNIDPTIVRVAGMTITDVVVSRFGYGIIIDDGNVNIYNCSFLSGGTQISALSALTISHSIFSSAACLYAINYATLVIRDTKFQNTTPTRIDAYNAKYVVINDVVIENATAESMLFDFLAYNSVTIARVKIENVLAYYIIYCESSPLIISDMTVENSNFQFFLYSAYTDANLTAIHTKNNTVRQRFLHSVQGSISISHIQGSNEQFHILESSNIYITNINIDNSSKFFKIVEASMVSISNISVNRIETSGYLFSIHRSKRLEISGVSITTIKINASSRLFEIIASTMVSISNISVNRIDNKGYLISVQRSERLEISGVSITNINIIASSQLFQIIDSRMVSISNISVNRKETAGYLNSIQGSESLKNPRIDITNINIKTSLQLFDIIASRMVSISNISVNKIDTEGYLISIQRSEHLNVSGMTITDVKCLAVIRVFETVESDIFKLDITRLKSDYIFLQPRGSGTASSRLRNILINDVSSKGAIKSETHFILMENLRITNANIHRALDFQGVSAKLNNVYINQIGDCVLSVNSNLTVENSVFIVSETGVSFRVTYYPGLKVKMKNVNITSLSKGKSAIEFRAEEPFDMDVERVNVVQDHPNMEIPIIDITYRKLFHPEFFSFLNSSLSCPLKSDSYYSMNTSVIFQLRFYCKACKNNFYSVFNDPAMFSLTPGYSLLSETVLADFPTEMDVPKTNPTLLIYRKPNRSSCKICPSEATCIGNIISNDNFWGFLNTSSGIIQFYPCSRLYCCSEGTRPCHSYKTCNHHRTGTLCGQCDDEYVIDSFSNECIPVTDCKHPIYFWLLFILTSFIYVLVIALLDKLKALKTFAIKICDFLTCHKLISSNASATENVIVNLQEIRLRRIQYNAHNNSEYQYADSEPLVVPNEWSSQDDSEDKCRYSGILNVFVGFYQIKHLITINLGSEYSSSSFDTTLTDIFNFDMIKVSFNLCPYLNMDALGKLVVMDFSLSFVMIVPVIMMALFLHIMWICRNPSTENTCCHEHPDDLLSEQCNANQRLKLDVYSSETYPEELSLCGRLYFCYVRLLTIRYKTFATFTLVTLNCVPIGNDYVPYVNGNIKCWNYWQYLAAVYLCLWIIPFPFTLFLSLKLLKANIITVERFICFTIFPVAVFVYYSLHCRRKFGYVATRNNKLKSAILEVFEQPYRTNARGNVIYWHSWLVLQRLLIACLTVFLINPLLRLAVVAPTLILFLSIHLMIKPYKDHLVNNLEAFSMIVLAILSVVNMFRAFLYVHRLRNVNEVTLILKIYGIVDQMLNPFLFLVIYFLYTKAEGIFKKFKGFLIQQFK